MAEPTITFDVTQEDWDRAIDARQNSNIAPSVSCPIAQAMVRNGMPVSQAGLSGVSYKIGDYWRFSVVDALGERIIQSFDTNDWMIKGIITGVVTLLPCEMHNTALMV